MDVLGLLNVVLIVVLTALWWGLYDAAHPPEGDSEDPIRSLAMSGMFPGVAALAGATSGPENLDHVLARIRTAGGYETIPIFLDGARQAYELIIDAVAKGKVDSISHLLTADVRRDFEAFIAARRQRGDVETLILISLIGADVVAATFEDVASIDVRFSAEIVSVTRDREGRIVDGHPERVARVSEIWTFERDTTVPRPCWLLAATYGDE